MKKFVIASALAVAALSGSAAQAKDYIKLSSGRVVPKHECSTTPCVDCTLLSYEACYEEANQAGLIQRPQIRMSLNRPNLPLEMECSRQSERDTHSLYLPYGKGQIVCPVVGATPVAATPSLRAKYEPAPAVPPAPAPATTGVEPAEFVIGSVVSFATPTMSCPNIDDATQADPYDAAWLAARDCRNLDPSVREWVVVSTGSSRALPSRVLTESYGCVVPKTRWDQTQIAKRSSGIVGGYEMSRVLDEECRHVVRKMS